MTGFVSTQRPVNMVVSNNVAGVAGLLSSFLHSSFGCKVIVLLGFISKNYILS